MPLGDNSTPDQSAADATSFQFFMDQQLRIGPLLGANTLTLKTMVNSAGSLVKLLNVIPGIDVTKFTTPLLTGINKVVDITTGLGKEFLQVEETAMKTFDTFGVGGAAASR